MKKVILCLLISSAAFANRPSLRWIIEMGDFDARLFGNDVCKTIQRTQDYISQCRRPAPVKGFYAYGKVKNAYGQEGYCGCIGYGN